MSRMAWLLPAVLAACATTPQRVAPLPPPGPVEAPVPQPAATSLIVLEYPGFAHLRTPDLDVAMHVPRGATIMGDGPVVIVVAGQAFAVQVQRWHDRNIAARREALLRELGPRFLRIQLEDHDAVIVQARPARDLSGGGFHLDALIADGPATYRCRSHPVGSFLLAEAEQMLAACRTLIAARRW